jgi:hypothetical protein
VVEYRIHWINISPILFILFFHGQDSQWCINVIVSSFRLLGSLFPACPRLSKHMIPMMHCSHELIFHELLLKGFPLLQQTWSFVYNDILMLAAGSTMPLSCASTFFYWAGLTDSWSLLRRTSTAFQISHRSFEPSRRGTHGENQGCVDPEESGSWQGPGGIHDFHVEVDDLKKRSKIEDITRSAGKYVMFVRCKEYKSHRWRKQS